MNRLPLLAFLALTVCHPAHADEKIVRCGADAEKLCGGAYSAHCLQSRENSLSSACRTLLREKQAVAIPPGSQAATPASARATVPAGPPVPEKLPPPLPEVPRDTGPCARDVQRLCPGTAGEPIGLCIKNHFDELSPECRHRVRQRQSEEGRKREWPAGRDWRP
jgi:hypothetical protein